MTLVIESHIIAFQRRYPENKKKTAIVVAITTILMTTISFAVQYKFKDDFIWSGRHKKEFRKTKIKNLINAFFKIFYYLYLSIY